MSNFVLWFRSFFGRLFGSKPESLPMPTLALHSESATPAEIPIPKGAPPTLGLRVSEFVETSVWD
jgi:hypothetical protein